MGAGARGRGVPGPSRRPAPRLHRPPDAALPRRSALRAGRPQGLPQARGPRPHRRPQDQQRGRPGPARRADGEGADHRRDRRRPARGRDRDRLRPARPRVRRLHGHRGHPPPGAERRADAPARGRGRPGRGRRPDPEGGGQRRDPRLGRERRDDPLRDRLGRRPGPVPGARPRPPAGDRRRGAGAGPRGRGRPPGADHRLRRRRLQLDRDLHAVHRRPRGRADRRRGGGGGARQRPPRRLARRRADRGAARLAVLDHRRRGGPDPRGPLGLGRPRLPGRRPRARPSARHRPRHLRLGHRRRRARRIRRAGPARGDHPGARVRPRDRLARRERRRRRLRRPLPLRPRRQGPRRGRGADGWLGGSTARAQTAGSLPPAILRFAPGRGARRRRNCGYRGMPSQRPRVKAALP